MTGVRLLRRPGAHGKPSSAAADTALPAGIAPAPLPPFAPGRTSWDTGALNPAPARYLQ
ncbi:hypothetical protein; putative signal peptide [Frankia alni ACN14a]|uniref:Uncharacterized protein n=1 Tax=Frankia alni (strain DSM 45986 / CECT 9034 / ACN14a) TaxID=326424 RepID=Q0RLM8_FRAAA|nr:hypothetical protein; putative signal peptide [Frankia alni ACN14a]